MLTGQHCAGRVGIGAPWWLKLSSCLLVPACRLVPDGSRPPLPEWCAWWAGPTVMQRTFPSGCSWQCLCKAFPWQRLELPQLVEEVAVPSWLVPTVQESCGAFTLRDAVVLRTRCPDVHHNLLPLQQKAGLASLHLPPVMSDCCC